MKILFVCTANSCRSQMAEGWARHLAPAAWTIASAGLMTYPISRRTRAVMAEVGLDLAGQQTKSIDVFDLDSFDLVVTLSEEAGSYLPALQDPKRHWRRPFTDPMAATGTPDEVRQAFRTGRDRARQVVLEVLDAYQGPRPGDGLSSDR